MSNEVRVELSNASRDVQTAIRALQTLFSTATPMAKQLRVWGDMEKLMRAAEKVQQGLQELTI